MRRLILSSLIAATLTAQGCSAEQFSQVTTAVLRARGGAAIRLATSATIAQMAVMHLTAALSQDAARQYDEANVPTLLGRSGSDFSYEVDTLSGTGAITRQVGGKQTVDLRFAFDSVDSNAGSSYSITGTDGHFEGYELLFQRLTIAFSAVLGDGLQPVRHESGSILLHVGVKAAGSLGVDQVEAVRLASLAYDFNYPVSKADTHIGDLVATNTDQDTLTGSILMIDGSPRVQGDLKGHRGSYLFKLSTTPRGELGLEEVPVPTGPN